ncbi:hypothetical protein SORBI_3004G184900 [Sorghum bicolor]|uniref:Pentacotripeptide-repeat region of PRORP domain-containing protein n=1 Tax=Sorghum bicolor TaxID=4558 RepID=A0A1Z5RN98_SORBI|nr:hypothetical protein SORBI_3004G184900 [Sorghum bicolor]
MAAAPSPAAPPSHMSAALITFPSSHPYPSLPAPPKPPTPRPPQLHLVPRVAASAATARRSASSTSATERLHALVRRGELDDALRLVESLAGLNPPSPAAAGPCAALIKKLCASGRTADARRVLGACGRDVVAYNAMVAGYCGAGQLDAARRLVADMPVEPDAYTYNTLIRGLCGRGRTSNALAVLDDMLRRGCLPDVVTYTILLEATCKRNGYKQAMKLLDEMRDKGCAPDIITYNVVLNERWEDAEKLMEEMAHKGCPPNVCTNASGRQLSWIAIRKCSHIVPLTFLF